MKAIILAAGRGTRLQPLTNTTPKPLIKIFWKTILEHNLEHIYQYVDEIIIIVKYKKEKFPEILGDNYKGTKITYHEQGDEKWTGGALKWLDIQDDIFVLYGDQILDKKDLEKSITQSGYGALAKQVEQPEKYGIYEIDENNFAKKLVEKPKTYIGNLANIWGFKLPKNIFPIIENLQLSERWEYEITDAVNILLEIIPFQVIEIEGKFIDVGYTWDILTANSHFLQQLETSDIRGTVEQWVTIKGNIVLEEGAILKSGTYIEGNCYIGKNTIIGPNTYLRGETCIGEKCHIWNAVEIKNSTIGNASNVAHLSYIWDSVIGNNVNIGWGMITANLRHDNKNIRVMVQWELVDSGKRKLGVIIGDNVKTGIKTMVMPGRIIENDSFTMPGEMVK